MLYDMQCCRCDWFGYTDDPNGECPWCHVVGTLGPSYDETDPEWDEFDEWDVMDEDPGM